MARKARWKCLPTGIIVTGFLILAMTALLVMEDGHTDQPLYSADYLYYYTRDTKLNLSEGIVSLDTDETLMRRVVGINSILNQFRRNIVTNNNRKGINNNPQLSNLNVIKEKGDMISKVRHLSGINGVALVSKTAASHSRNVSDKAKSDLLVTEYYNWVASEPLCTWINTPKALGHGYSEAYKTCTTCTSALLQTDKSVFPRSKEALFYLLILEDSVISSVGDVAWRGMKLVPDACNEDYRNYMKISGKVSSLPVHQEVFVISQFWGNGYFHRLIEVLPRIAPFVTFLQQNPGIKIHAPSTDKTIKTFMTFLGLDPSRIVTGDMRSHVAYLPKGSPCGNGGFPETQILSHLLIDYTIKHLNPGKRNKVILIKRSRERRLTHHDQIKDMVEGLTEDHGLVFVEWRDDPVLSIEEGARLFHEAVLVVAPHGAGEANVILSRRGTYLIEVLCDKPHVNMCYQALAYRLGLRYHGIPADSGCLDHLDISASKLKPVVNDYLKQITSSP